MAKKASPATVEAPVSDLEGQEPQLVEEQAIDRYCDQADNLGAGAWRSLAEAAFLFADATFAKQIAAMASFAHLLESGEDHYGDELTGAIIGMDTDEWAQLWAACVKVGDKEMASQMARLHALSILRDDASEDDSKSDAA